MKLYFEKFNDLRNWILVAIFILSFLLRYFCITWGLPYSFHPDEHYMIDFTSNFVQNNWNPVNFNPRPFIYGPVLMMIVSFIVKIIIYLNSFLHLNLSIQNNILFLGRLIVAFMGAITSIFVFKLCRFFCSNRISFLSSIFLIFAPLHLVHSSYFTVDIPLTLFIILSIYYCQKLLSNPKIIYYLLIAFFSSLAFSTKFTSALLFFPILISHFIAQKKYNNYVKLLIHPYLLLSFFVFIIITFILLHYIFYPFENFSLFLQQLKTNALISRPRDVGCIYQNKFFFYSKSVFQSFKPFIAIFSPLAFITFLFKQKKYSAPILSFIVFFVFVHCIVKNYSARYILPIIPLVSFLIAYFIDILFCYSKRIKLLTLLIVIVVFIQLFLSFFNVIKIVYIMNLPETRILVIDWVNKFLPSDAFITFEGKYPNLKRSNSQKFLDLFLKQNNILKKKKNDFYVISSEANESFQEIMSCTQRKEFYNALESNNKLIKRFWYQILDFTQPEIKIIKNKFSPFPPFYEMFIQPNYSNNFNNITFLNKVYSSYENGDFILTKDKITLFIISPNKLDSLMLYFFNSEDHISKVKIKNGLSSKLIYLNPHEKKVIYIEPIISFPYLKYLYKIKIYLLNAKDDIYGKIITDPFNESLIYCTINDFDNALLRIQQANQIENDNPIISYFKSLYFYKKGLFEEAIKIINKIPSNLLQLYSLTFLPNQPFIFNKFNKKLDPIPPGFYQLRFKINSKIENEILHINILSSDIKIYQRKELKKGDNIFLFSFKIEQINKLIINIRNESNESVSMEEINLSLDLVRLLENLNEKKFNYKCW